MTPDIRRAAGRVAGAIVLALAVITLAWHLQHRPRRVPAAIASSSSAQVVVDSDGRTILDAIPRDFPMLPILSGKNVRDRMAPLFEQLLLHPVVKHELRVAELGSAQRWNLVFSDGLLVKLSAEPTEGDFQSIDALLKSGERAHVQLVDLRFAHHVIVITRGPDNRGHWGGSEILSRSDRHAILKW